MSPKELVVLVLKSSYVEPIRWSHEVMKIW